MTTSGMIKATNEFMGRSSDKKGAGGHVLET